MYDVSHDAYCYRGTNVLKNKAGLRRQDDLDRFEAVMTAQRFEEPVPSGRFDVRHYRALHRHIFQDVYPWAGRLRTVRISKGESAFCYPEHIPGELKRLFAGLKRDKGLRGLTADAFAHGAAAFLATLNAIHAFRDGNGRAQTAFLLMLAYKAGHPLDMGQFRPDSFREAMVASFYGREDALCADIFRLVTRDGDA